jgi:hypothetical protein
VPDRSKRGDQRPATTPQEFPETTPPTYPGTEYSFVLQGVFELKASLAKLEQAVAHLQNSLGEHKQDLKTLNRTVWVATGVVLTISAIGSVVLVIFGRQLWDVLSQIGELLRHAPKP